LHKKEKKAKIKISFGGSMRSFGYKFPDFFLEYGPITAKNIDAAKAVVRKIFGVRRLPPGFSIWDISERPFGHWHISA
jgi:hypothetical protein